MREDEHGCISCPRASAATALARAEREALTRCDDLNLIRRVAHRHGYLPHTCQVMETVFGRFGGYNSCVSRQSFAICQKPPSAYTTHLTHEPLRPLTTRYPHVSLRWKANPLPNNVCNGNIFETCYQNEITINLRPQIRIFGTRPGFTQLRTNKTFWLKL